MTTASLVMPCELSPVVGLKQRRKHARQCGALISGAHIGLERHRHVERHGYGAHETLVVAGRERSRIAPRIGKAHHLQHGRDVQLLEGIVVEAFVAKIEDEVGPQLGNIALERGVIVEIAELVGRQLGQRILEAPDGVIVLGIEGAAALDRYPAGADRP